MTDSTLRRRGAHSMERIERPTADIRGWSVFAGDLGESFGVYRTKAEAKDALDTWHYFHPEEQRARDAAWVRAFVSSIRGALEDLGADGVESMLRVYEHRYHLIDLESSAA